MFCLKFVFLLLLLQTILGVNGFLDFTCYSANPRISINGNDGMFIGGYTNGNNTLASVSFERASFTGTGQGLPSGSFEEFINGSAGKTLYMPLEGGRQRIGAFNCLATKNGQTEVITTIVMAKNSEIVPKDVTQTVSIGESVNLEMFAESSENLQWKHNGVIVSKWNYHNKVTIKNITLVDAGVYECYKEGTGEEGIHAIFQLIVRGCAQGSWGDDCQSECPDCYNGGICDDRSGECVCAPGFKGTQCRTALGRNRWGHDGTSKCSEGNVHENGCKGKMFCLPHPYGCSCAAGFKGLDCDHECDIGTYGANCRSQCNCADGVSCLKDTGECDKGQCHPDWYGINCQAPLPVSNLQATIDDNSISLQWDPDSSPCNNLIDYKIQYQHLHQHRCIVHVNDTTHLAAITNSTQIYIGGLFSYSTYRIFVTTRHDYIRESEVSFINVTTGETDSLPAANLKATINGNTISIQWDPESTLCSELIDYTVEYQLVFQDQCSALAIDSFHLVATTKSAQISIGDLYFYSTYRIYVTTRYNATRKNTIASINVTTAQSVPTSSPSDVIASEISSNEVKFQWSKPPCGFRHGQITSYIYRLKNAYGTIIVNNATEFTDVTIKNLLPFTNYRFVLTASNMAGAGPAYTMTISTKETVPSTPRILRAFNVTKTSIQVSWQKPQYPNGVIRKYVIQNKIISKPYDSSFSVSSESTTYHTISDSSVTSYTLSDLVPSTQYKIRLSAYTLMGKGEDTSVKVFTLPASIEDIPIPKYLPIITDDKKTCTNVSIVIPRSDSELVTGYLVGVRLKTHLQERHTIQFEHKKVNPEAYVAAKVTKDTVNRNPHFMIGDGKTYGMFFNPPLIKGATYSLYTAVYSRTNETLNVVSWSEGTDVTLSFGNSCDPQFDKPVLPNSDLSRPNTTMIVIFVSVFAGMLVVIGGVVLKNRALKKQLNSTTNNNTLLESRILPNVPGCAETQMSEYAYELQMTGHVEVMDHEEVKPEDIYQDVGSVNAIRDDHEYNSEDLYNEPNSDNAVDNNSEDSSDLYDDVSVKGSRC